MQIRIGSKLPAILLVCGVTLALFVASSCSPMVLGNTTRDGIKREKPLVYEDDRAKLLRTVHYKAVSKDEALGIEISNDSGDVCKADLKLKTMEDGYPVIGAMIPGISNEPYMVYAGQWQSNQSSACLEIVQVPGNTKVEVAVFEPDDGARSLLICTDAEYTHGLPCRKMLGFQVPVVKGVDDN